MFVPSVRPSLTPIDIMESDTCSVVFIPESATHSTKPVLSVSLNKQIRDTGSIPVGGIGEFLTWNFRKKIRRLARLGTTQFG